MSVFANIITGQEILNEELKGSMLTGNVQFEVGGHTLTADMLLPQSAPMHATPIIGSLYRKGVLIWKFQTSRPADFNGRAHLVEVKGTVVIAWVTREMILIKIESVEQIVGGKPLGLKASLELKFAAAEHLGCDQVQQTASETKVATTVNAKRAAEQKANLEAERTRREEQKVARANAREEKRQRILGRERQSLIGPAGKKLAGLPVVGDEWECLADGTWVVEVTTCTDGKVGELLRHVVVHKQGGKVELRHIETDLRFRDKVAVATVNKPEPSGTRLVEFEDDFHEVPFYKPAEVETLKRLGVIGVFATRYQGALLILRIKDCDGEMKLFKVEAKEFA